MFFFHKHSHHGHQLCLLHNEIKVYISLFLLNGQQLLGFHFTKNVLAKSISYQIKYVDEEKIQQ